MIEYHVPRREWINQHPGCLHLWRPKDIEDPAASIRDGGIQLGMNKPLSILVQLLGALLPAALKRTDALRSGARLGDR